MPRIELAPEVFDDFDRFFDHQTKYGIEDTSERIAEINEAIQVLAHSPLIGRKAKGGKRELVIGQESPRWPLQIPPPVAGSNSPRSGQWGVSLSRLSP